MDRTAPLTSKRCILYIYSTNVGTEYFKHALYSPFFNMNMFKRWAHRNFACRTEDGSDVTRNHGNGDTNHNMAARQVA